VDDLDAVARGRARESYDQLADSHYSCRRFAALLSPIRLTNWRYAHPQFG
jgi:hypothetical protein